MESPFKSQDLQKKSNRSKKKNIKLQFEIEKFESPENLMKLARTEAFTHLKMPLVKEILSLKPGNRPKRE